MFVALFWIAVLLTCGLQLMFVVFFFRHIHDIANNYDGYAHRAFVPEYATQPVSVIICAKNEAEHLQKHLQKVLSQHYRFPDGTPAFEVIVVNDGSTDDTAEVLETLSRSHVQLKPLHLDADAIRIFPGKKFPLSQALGIAKNEWIVCTDADCEPASDAWLHFLTAPLKDGKKIVAGYGGYVREKGWLNAFIRYETRHTFLQYFSYTKAGMPYMAVGRNLAATKSMFLKAQSSAVWSALPSGDDDLLIQLCATKENMAVIAHPASFTWSAAKASLHEYLLQKRRHVSTGKFYSLPAKLSLGAYALVHFLWWILFAFCMGCFPYQGPATFCLFIPMIMWVVTLQEGASFLSERSTISGWMCFSFCWMIYNAVLTPYILWKTKQRWK